MATNPTAGNSGKALESSGVWLDIGAVSPLFTYEPERNTPGIGWSQDGRGGSVCSGGTGTYAVGAQGLYCQSSSLSGSNQSRELMILVTEVTFTWAAGPEYSVSVGVDGQLQSGPSSSGSVTLNAPAGLHAIRLEATAAGNANATPAAGGTTSPSSFQFLGVKVNTAVVPSG
jgi:hypothetical protein